LCVPRAKWAHWRRVPQDVPQGQRRALSTWPRLGARPQDASQGRRRHAPVRWVRLQAGPYYDAGPSCARPGQARGTGSRKRQPSAFFHTRLRGKGQQWEEASRPFRTTSWPGLQATACPSGRKGLTVLVACPSYPVYSSTSPPA